LVFSFKNVNVAVSVGDSIPKIGVKMSGTKNDD